MSERTLEKKVEVYTLGNQDAMAGFPMNRFLASDPDYKEGYESAKEFMKAVIREPNRLFRV